MEYIEVTITKLVKEVDLRRVHDYRMRYGKGLKQGEAVLLVNVAKDKCRLIDSFKGVHNYYARPGRIFDIEEIEAHLGSLRLKPVLKAKARTTLLWKKAA